MLKYWTGPLSKEYLYSIFLKKIAPLPLHKPKFIQFIAIYVIYVLLPIQLKDLADLVLNYPPVPQSQVR